MKYKILLICLVVMAFFVSSVTALTVKTDNMANATTNIEKTAVANNGATSTDIAQNAIAISGAATIFTNSVKGGIAETTVASINFPNPFNANANNAKTLATTEAAGKTVENSSVITAKGAVTATATGDNNAEVAYVIIVPTSAAFGITLVTINTSTATYSDMAKPVPSMEVAYVIGVKTYSSDAIVIYLSGKSTTAPMTLVNYAEVAYVIIVPTSTASGITMVIKTSGANTDETAMAAVTIVKPMNTDSMVDGANNTWCRTNSLFATTTVKLIA